MKTLKFVPELVTKILEGTKTSTWRLFDDKDLQKGDKIIFLNKETEEAFGIGTLTDVKTQTLGELTDADWEGHERFASEEDMYKTYRGYYGDRVGSDSEVKIIKFDFEPKE